MTADEALARLDRFRRFSLEAASGIVLRHCPLPRTRTAPSLLWAMALLGLFLLPVDYRAGAEQPHAHSLPQLWVDAADGAIHHHGLAGSDWLDPAVASEASGSSVVGGTTPDVGEQQDSAPAASGLHLLLAALVVLPAVSAVRRPIPNPARRLAGLVPRIPSPPPRPAIAA